MSRKWILWRVLATVILAGLLIAGGAAIYHAGWSQGYGAGQLATWGEEGTPLPYPLHRLGYPEMHLTPFLFGAGLLKVALGLVFLAVILKLARFVIWGTALRPAMYGSWRGPFACGPRDVRRYHRYWHGPVPPWRWDESPVDETEANDNEAK